MYPISRMCKNHHGTRRALEDATSIVCAGWNEKHQGEARWHRKLHNPNTAKSPRQPRRRAWSSMGFLDVPLKRERSPKLQIMPLEMCSSRSRRRTLMSISLLGQRSTFDLASRIVVLQRVCAQCSRSPNARTPRAKLFPHHSSFAREYQEQSFWL